MRIVDTGILNQSEPGTARATLTCPSVVPLSDGTLLGTSRAGSTKDGADETVEFYRSLDQGATWSAPWQPFKPPRVRGLRGSLKCCYLTELAPGRLLAAAIWVDRETYPGQGIFHPDTEGCLPLKILLAESGDLGNTWSPFQEVPMPEELGPPSLTNPILLLPDGTLAMSVESNKNYHDSSTWNQRVVVFHSTDSGQSWGPPVVAGFDPSGRIFNWDQRLAVAPDGRIAAFAWTYDTKTRKFLNIHRRISTDGGRDWSPAEDLGITDQASHPAMLPDGRVVLAWVDRFGTATIRARVAPAIDAPFAPESEVVLYRHPASAGDTRDADGALGLSLWSFGLPYAEVLPDGDVLVVYYAGNESTMDIHWSRIHPDPGEHSEEGRLS